MKTSNLCIASLLLSLAASGCYGGIALPGNDSAGGTPSDSGDSAEDSSGDPSGDPSSGGSGDDPSGGGDDPPDEEPSPFHVPEDEVRLLPFHVRARNLAEVVGVTEDHSMFTQLRATRYQLGDHDYANGIAPDLRWDAQKMQVWVKAMIPVCDSAEFKDRYPDLLTDPTALLQQVYGRQPTDDEITAYDDVMVADATPDVQYQLACASILSSLEFVAD